ncbi:unnamed protein product, partial [Musa acuminata subsp. burmannicoides]
PPPPPPPAGHHRPSHTVLHCRQHSLHRRDAQHGEIADARVLQIRDAVGTTDPLQLNRAVWSSNTHKRQAHPQDAATATVIYKTAKLVASTPRGTEPTTYWSCKGIAMW